MSKRFATIFFISVATIMIIAVVLFLILFLAPGVSIFGLRYIGAGMHDYTKAKVNLYERYGGSYRGITINTYEVPVNIIFTEDNVYEVQYFDKFSGLTTTKIDDPDMEITFSSGIVNINILEFHKFLWQTSTTERYVNLYVPLAFTADGIANEPINIVINSTHSPVSFSKSETDDSRVPKFNTIQIKTKGKIDYGTKVRANEYKLETARSISINKDKSNIIEAVSYNLKTTLGKITAESDIEGDFSAETKNGSVKLISCKNLYVTTEYGSIDYAGEDDKKVHVKGIVKISTKSGKVNLGDVDGIGENEIETSSGSIYINKILDGSATSKRGRIEIKSVQNFKIETNVGKVYVQEASYSIEVSTKRGDIHLGGKNMMLQNPKVFSRIGRVYISSADGNVDVETVSSDVEFTNKSSENIKINCGGKLVAEGLTGAVDIYSEENFDITFSKISANSTIKFGSACKKATITALNNTIDDTGFIVKGKRVLLQQFVDNQVVYPNGQDTNTDSVDNKSPGKTFPYVLEVGPAEDAENNANIDLIIKG